MTDQGARESSLAEVLNGPLLLLHPKHRARVELADLRARLAAAEDQIADLSVPVSSCSLDSLSMARLARWLGLPKLANGHDYNGKTLVDEAEKKFTETVRRAESAESKLEVAVGALEDIGRMVPVNLLAVHRARAALEEIRSTERPQQHGDMTCGDSLPADAVRRPGVTSPGAMPSTEAIISVNESDRAGESRKPSQVAGEPGEDRPATSPSSSSPPAGNAGSCPVCWGSGRDRELPWNECIDCHGTGRADGGGR